jgi:hypothetical protein
MHMVSLIRGRRGRTGSSGRAGCVAVVALSLGLGWTATAAAHVERTAYWPDPSADTSVKPPAGGAVPRARSLVTATSTRGPGKTRVVCQPDSLTRLQQSIATAQQTGFNDRPTEPKAKLSTRAGSRLLTINQTLFSRCAYHEIQPAVTASGNNDRVVIMPGVYSEPTSRAVPNLPPECDQYRATSDHGSGAVTYAYQYHCPNAQSLVAVIGRALGPGQDPGVSPTGRPDPHGIPNLGQCIRCNLQIEGSGVSADDTVIDAGRVESGNAAPIEPKKDVTVKADRADGVVIRNLTARHAAEHDFYVLETDGYLLSRIKAMYAGEYGTLTFTTDHGLTDTCEAVGNGDSGVYPGGAPDTGTRRDQSYYPDYRLNQTITRCDSHHNNLGYSGTMGNATNVVNNNFYDNTTGIATDSFFAGGHPGYPQDSAHFEHNRIYSNNFNVYAQDSDVKSAVPVPIGVGILIAGGDDNVVASNYIYDNWRRGTMLLAVPDAISCAPNPDQGAPPCTPEGAATTSNRNHYFNNVMGRTPGGQVLPNGVDFWWDEFPTNTGNCWTKNIGSNGTTTGITSDPPPPPVEGTSIPHFLPEDCNAPTNVGLGSPTKEAVLVGCVADFAQGTYDATVCDWFAPPPKPSGQQPATTRGASPLASPGSVTLTTDLCRLIGGDGGTLTCSPFARRL